MMIYLGLEGGSGKDRWVLEQGTNQIGRNPNGDGCRVAIDADAIPDGNSISRHHVCITLDGDQAAVRKVPGSNPVMVNGKVLAESAQAMPLSDGDQLTLGKVTFQLRKTRSKGVKPPLVCPADKASASPTEPLRVDAAEIEQLRRRQKRLEKAIATTQQVLEERDPQTALSAALEAVVKAFGLQCGLVAERNRGGELIGRAFFGLQAVRDLSNVSQTIIRRALETGKPVMTHDAPKQFGAQPGGSLKQLGIGPALCSPLRSGENDLGVIYLDKRNAGDWQPFTDEDGRYLETFATMITGALVAIQDRQKLDEAVLARARIIGRSKPMLILARKIRQFAQASDRSGGMMPALILGPSGSGKELVARAIRAETNRRDKPFIRVNMGEYAANSNGAQSALFGHRKGAFSGAIEDRSGAVGAADGGVLFLDEIGDMPTEVQKLLKRFLADDPDSYGTYSRLGEDKERRANTIVIMATNKDLDQMAKSNEFEQDMKYRLQSAFRIEVPRLDERREDIPEIMDHYLTVFNEMYGRQVSIIGDAMKVLSAATWPDNVRGLRAVVQSLVVQADDVTMVIKDRTLVEELLRRREPGGHGDPHGWPPPLWKVELDHCVKVWESHGRHYRKASDTLEIAENTLRKRLLEGQLRRLGGNLERMAEFFNKSPQDIEAELRTHRINVSSGGRPGLSDE